MKIISTFFLLFSFWQIGAAQSSTSSDKQDMTVSSQDAFYPKGEQALYGYVMMNAKYTEEAKKNYAAGNVDVSFDVMADSTVKNVKIISDAGQGTGESVKGVLETLKFAPAIMMGVKVKSNVMMTFPVKAH